MSAPRLLLALILGLALVPLLAVGPGVAASATLTVSAARVMSGERFTVSGRLSTPVSRPVTLRYRVGGTWRKVARTQTSRSGAFAFRQSLTGISTRRSYRVVAPATTVHRRRYRPTSTPTSTPRAAVSVVDQRGDVRVLPAVDQPGREPAAASSARRVAVARFTPARPGRRVTLTGSDGASTSVSMATQDAQGEARFVPSASAARTWSYTATAQPWKGSAALTTGVTADPRWELAFADEFATLNRASVWTDRGTQRLPAAQRTCARADPSMATVAGGVLRLRVTREPGTGTCTWRNPESGVAEKHHYFLNGHLGTAPGGSAEGFSYRYGVAAARVKFQQPRGMHGSFWLQDAGPETNSEASPEPGSGIGAGIGSTSPEVEIDVAEFFGQGYPQGGLAQFLHTSTGKVGGLQPGAAHALSGRTDSWWTRFHVLSVDWTPQGYVFRIDGVRTFATSELVSDRREFVVLSLLSSDWELSRMPASESGLLQVDWVRVWQELRPAS